MCKICGADNSYLFTYTHEQTGQTKSYCRYCLHLRDNKKKKIVRCSMKVKTQYSKKVQFALNIPFPLSPEQRKSVFMLKGYNQPGARLLLHAICGAGKTEIVAAYLADALRRGKTIGWSIARRDVVIELKDRLQEYFYKTHIIALYQDSEDLGKVAQLTVFTTARLFRYSSYFDILIIDENDAFPFNVDMHQQYAAQQSIVRTGVIVHVSATILKTQRKEYDKIVSLARRFHAVDLPMITFEYLHFQHFINLHRIPKKLHQFIKEMLDKKYPIFFFVSSKNRGVEVAHVLAKKYGRENVVNISSAVENRTPILQGIRDGKTPLIVTTTILERGVTFKNVQVIVMDSDASLFDAQTLVQIAGRVGRPIDAPYGNIIFMYENGVTNAMKKAAKYHAMSNKGEVLFL